jgi:hypothetical protein
VIFSIRKRDLKNLASVSNYSEFNGEKTIQFVVYVPINKKKTEIKNAQKNNDDDGGY